MNTNRNSFQARFEVYIFIFYFWLSYHNFVCPANFTALLVAISWEVGISFVLGELSRVSSLVHDNICRSEIVRYSSTSHWDTGSIHVRIVSRVTSPIKIL